jgi:pyruvate dehydrogenase complex dehydrogenase (E1) component
MPLLLYATNEFSGRGSIFIDTSPNSIATYAQDYIDRFSNAASKSGGSSKLERLVKRATALNRIAHLTLIACLGVNDFVRSGDVVDLYRQFGIGADSIVGAAWDLIEDARGTTESSDNG